MDNELLNYEENSATELGVIVRGTLNELEMRLMEGRSIEDVRVGKFVVIQGEKIVFFPLSMIFD